MLADWVGSEIKVELTGSEVTPRRARLIQFDSFGIYLRVYMYLFPPIAAEDALCDIQFYPWSRVKALWPTEPGSRA